MATRQAAHDACLAPAEEGIPRNGPDAQELELKAAYKRANRAVQGLEKKRARMAGNVRAFGGHRRDSFESRTSHPSGRSDSPPAAASRPHPEAREGALAQARRARPAAPVPPPASAATATALGVALGSHPGPSYTSPDAGIGSASLSDLQRIRHDLLLAARRQPGLASILLEATASESQIRRARMALQPDQIARSRTLPAAARAGQLERAAILREILDDAIAKHAELSTIALSA